MEDLPPFPAVLTELIGLTGSDTSAAGDLRACIEKDVVLTARLLKLANSAFYAPTVPVASVRQAVVLLGFLSVRGLAMAAATLKVLSGHLPVYGFQPGGLWMHSYLTAQLARDLSRESGEGRRSQERAHVGGLLHDVGKIILGPVLEELSDSPHEAGAGEWERRISGLNHCEVGGRLAEKWRLPSSVVEAIRYHHSWEAADPELLRTVSLVSLADLGARRIGLGFQRPFTDAKGETRACSELRIEEARYRSLVDSFGEKVSLIEGLFRAL